MCCPRAHPGPLPEERVRRRPCVGKSGSFLESENNMNGNFMSMERIEEILRKTPLPKAPEDLLRKLTAGIRLPPITAVRTEGWDRPSWARRWLPALSFAAIFLVCVAVIAVQANILSDLQRQSGELRAEKEKLEMLRAENAEYQRLTVENQELDRLRKDNAELLKLRGEVAQLQGLLQDGGKLRAENQQLRASASQAGFVAGTNDYFAEQEARAERIACVNNLKQVGLAARLWSGDNQDVYPTNFISMTNELGTWKILQCPSDKSRNVTNWAEVAAGNISYIMDSPGIPETYPTVVFVECPIHHNVCLVDGSVQQFSPEGYQKHIKMIDGRKQAVP